VAAKLLPSMRDRRLQKPDLRRDQATSVNALLLAPPSAPHAGYSNFCGITGAGGDPHVLFLARIPLLRVGRAATGR
jgi:hypothetical protein